MVVNDRWGKGDACKHGGYFTCHDRFNPGQLLLICRNMLNSVCR